MHNKPRTRPERRMRRGNPGLEQEIHDPYRSDHKTPTPAACPDCGAVYVRGRWTWQAASSSEPAESLSCPACRRTKDRYPAGELTVSGAFALAHAEEALRLIDNVAQAEGNEHPLHRIMQRHRAAEEIRIETTDIHLPRRIGHALEGAWGGTLTTHYDEQGYFVRVTWQRDE